MFTSVILLAGIVSYTVAPGQVCVWFERRALPAKCELISSLDSPCEATSGTCQS